MNPSLPAAVLLAVLASVWLVARRRPRSILRSTDTGAVAALNRGQIERLQAAAPSLPPPAPPAGSASGSGASQHNIRAEGEDGLALPRSARERLLLRQRLIRWSRGTRAQRLAALAICGRWRHGCMLSLVRQALRDPDPVVMAAAARAMDAFRGRPLLTATAAVGSPQGPGTSSERPPRNVARTR